jgi:trehalose utilization protein
VLQAEGVVSGAARSRRHFLQTASAAAAGAALTSFCAEGAEAGSPAEALRVRLRGEARHVELVGRILRSQEDLEVLPDQAPGPATVLVWCAGDGASPREAAAERIAFAIREGRLGLVLLGDDPALARALFRTEDGLWDWDSGRTCSDVEVRVAAPRHPVVRGVSGFHLAAAETSTGFRGPAPDLVVLDRSGGEWLGLVWTVGRGRVFHYQPRGEAKVLWSDPAARRLLANAVRWSAPGERRA